MRCSGLGPLKCWRADAPSPYSCDAAFNTKIARSAFPHRNGIETLSPEALNRSKSSESRERRSRKGDFLAFRLIGWETVKVHIQNGAALPHLQGADRPVRTEDGLLSESVDCSACEMRHPFPQCLRLVPSAGA